METDARVLSYAVYAPGVDRTELARELGLPAPTIVSAVRRLIAAGDLIEVETTTARTGAGRRPRELRPSGPATLVGLVSWDGAATRAACLDVTGAIVAATEMITPDPRAGIAGLHPAVREVIALAAAHPGHRLRSVVLSVPAPYLTGRGAPPVVEGATPTFSVIAPGDLEAELSAEHGLPVTLENDANLAALGELYGGAVRGRSHAVCVLVNDHGVGGAVVVNGALARGARGYAGELSHLQIDRDGPLCACGGRGCLSHHIRDRVVASAQAAYDAPITFADLPRPADAGDAGAARMLRDVGRGLGGPLAHLCTFLDPELLLVGGSLGPSAAHVVAGLRDVLAVQAPPAIAANMEVLASGLGPDAELLGAIELGRLAARTR
ncbi:xylose repressor [Actinoplanes sp. OR16]|uniref:ROK family protein n=1 Tax=Actinoplanes sp. OR16 TaxID=946334 RepID=UPI000F6FCF00|nr:ROK family protein [Actinoplanes sp. OR16]BBH69952.1 xylose repressor [Actinoplanes sp. OR16]